MTLAFSIYILGCSILSTRDDRINIPLLGSLRVVREIRDYNLGNARLATLYRHMRDIFRGETNSVGGFWRA